MLPTVSGDLHAPPAVSTAFDPEPSNFFDVGSPYLSHPLLTEARTCAEVDHLVGRLNLVSESRLVDVGCGAGRHTIELARRGMQVTGIDPSATMIDAAKERARLADVSPRLIVGTAADLGAEQYDAALCLFTTFGQVGRTGDTSMLHDIRGQLTPGSPIVVEVPQRSLTIDAFEPRTEIPTPSGSTTISRSFDSTTNVVTERFEVASDGAIDRFVLRFRLFDGDELALRLDEAGFVGIEITDGYSNRPLAPTTPMMVATARVP